MPYKSNADQAAWFQRNKQKVYENRKEHLKWWDNSSYQRTYREKHKIELAAYIREYQKKHPEKLKAIKAKRRAAVLQRSPKWISAEESKAITEFYAKCPQGYEVDHVLPLQGKNVSGLHVLANLQYLPTIENRKKGNKFNV